MVRPLRFFADDPGYRAVRSCTWATREPTYRHQLVLGERLRAAERRHAATHEGIENGKAWGI